MLGPLPNIYFCKLQSVLWLQPFQFNLCEVFLSNEHCLKLCLSFAFFCIVLIFLCVWVTKGITPAATISAKECSQGCQLKVIGWMGLHIYCLQLQVQLATLVHFSSQKTKQVFRFVELQPMVFHHAIDFKWRRKAQFDPSWRTLRGIFCSTSRRPDSKRMWICSDLPLKLSYQLAWPLVWFGKTITNSCSQWIKWSLLTPCYSPPSSCSFPAPCTCSRRLPRPASTWTTCQNSTRK